MESAPFPPAPGWSRTVLLEHMNGDGTGNWRLLGAGPDRWIECERCGHADLPTAGNRAAAIAEHYAGIYLRRLASEGAAMLTGNE